MVRIQKEQTLPEHRRMEPVTPEIEIEVNLLKDRMRTAGTTIRALPRAATFLGGIQS